MVALSKAIPALAKVDSELEIFTRMAAGKAGEGMMECCAAVRNRPGDSSDIVSGSFAIVADGKAVRGIVVEAGVLAYAGACSGYAAPLRNRLGTPPGPGPDMPLAGGRAIAGSKP